MIESSDIELTLDQWNSVATVARITVTNSVGHKARCWVSVAISPSGCAKATIHGMGKTARSDSSKKISMPWHTNL